MATPATPNGRGPAPAPPPRVSNPDTPAGGRVVAALDGRDAAARVRRPDGRAAVLPVLAWLVREDGAVEAVLLDAAGPTPARALAVLAYIRP